MLFAPQPRALFRHLDFQKCPEADVFCAFSLPHVLRAPTACTFSTSQLPKDIRTGRGLTLLTSKCASRHNSVHIFDIDSQSNGQKVALTCSNLSILTENVLRATTACNFSSFIWRAGSAPTAVASLLLFDPPEPQIIEKTQSFATFLPFREPASSLC